MGNMESADGPSEMKSHPGPQKVPMPRDPAELEERFSVVLVSPLSRNNAVRLKVL